MSYNIITDRIEVRSRKENNQPRYIVNGTAMIANKKHIYEYTKNKDGSYKTLKSMFTPKCIASIKKQSQNKRLFVDAQHELALNTNIKSLLNGKLSPEEMKKVDVMLNTKMLPISKLNDIEIKDDRMEIFTELNPMFREVDESHQHYFDAVWHNLENKFLNGISANFGNFQYTTDDAGDIVIDDVDVLGFSYVSSPAEHDNTINEVAIRAIQEGINIRTGDMKMVEDEKVKLAEEKAKLEEDKKAIIKEKEELARQKTEDAAVRKKVEIDKQVDEQKKLKEELERNAIENKKLQDELNSVKGQVAQHQVNKNLGAGNVPTSDFYKGHLKEITAEHDKTMEVLQKGQKPIIDKSMSGFGELVNLQAKANNLTADLDPTDAEIARSNRLLMKGDADLVAPNKKNI